jgi:hypothetical protein
MLGDGKELRRKKGEFGFWERKVDTKVGVGGFPLLPRSSMRRCSFDTYSTLQHLYNGRYPRE